MTVHSARIGASPFGKRIVDTRGDYIEELGKAGPADVITRVLRRLTCDEQRIDAGLGKLLWEPVLFPSVIDIGEVAVNVDDNPGALAVELRR